MAKRSVIVVVVGAIASAIGLAQSALGVAHGSHGWEWPSPLWIIPVLVGTIAGLWLLLQEERQSLTELENRLAGVEDKLALDSVWLRYKRTVDGPPAVHEIEFRLRFHNTSDMPVIWRISDIQVLDTPGVVPDGLSQGGTVAPDKIESYTLIAHVQNGPDSQAQEPPRNVTMSLVVKYRATAAPVGSELELRRRFVIPDLPAAPSREWTDVSFLYLDS